jgi:hypothetical protein
LEISKKILVATITVVLTSIITLLVNTAWNEYAVIGYQLSGPSDFNSFASNLLKIDLKLENSGNIGGSTDLKDICYECYYCGGKYNWCPKLSAL